MSVLLLRAGLWGLVLVLALYVIGEAVPTSPVGEMVTAAMLIRLTQVAGGLVALGVIVGVIERMWPRGAGRCRVCRKKVQKPGAMYCKEHLNAVLEEEDLRTRTLNVRIPD
jgi:hypothetical protein